MKSLVKTIRFLEAKLWTLWLAILLSLSPSVIGYVACVGRPNEALSPSVVNTMSWWMKVLELPSQFLWPARRFPAFWHEHLRAEFFWQTVARYYVGNFVSWWIVLVTLSVVVGFTKRLASSAPWRRSS